MGSGGRKTPSRPSSPSTGPKMSVFVTSDIPSFYHRTNTVQGNRLTGVRVSDGSRYRRPAGRITVLEGGDDDATCNRISRGFRLEDQRSHRCRPGEAKNGTVEQHLDLSRLARRLFASDTGDGADIIIDVKPVLERDHGAVACEGAVSPG